MKIEPMAKLSCGHYMRVTVEQARSYDHVQCETCRQWCRPDTVLLREWHVWCATDGCEWERWVGQLRRDAGIARDRHTRHPRYSHVVRMDYATVPGMEYALHIPPTVTPPEETDHERTQLF